MFILHSVCLYLFFFFFLGGLVEGWWVAWEVVVNFRV